MKEIEIEMSKYESNCMCGAGIPLSCVTCRLARVEADLATLRTAHAAVPTAPERQAVYEAGRERGHKESETWVLPAVLRSGEAPEVLTPEAQDARAWKAIEAWHEALGEEDLALAVSIEGPFAPPEHSARYCVRLPGGYSSRSATRSDALAHAAQWCLAETARLGSVSK